MWWTIKLFALALFGAAAAHPTVFDLPRETSRPAQDYLVYDRIHDLHGEYSTPSGETSELHDLIQPFVDQVPIDQEYKSSIEATIEIAVGDAWATLTDQERAALARAARSLQPVFRRLWPRLITMQEDLSESESQALSDASNSEYFYHNLAEKKAYVLFEVMTVGELLDSERLVEAMREVYNSVVEDDMSFTESEKLTLRSVIEKVLPVQQELHSEILALIKSYTAKDLDTLSKSMSKFAENVESLQSSESIHLLDE